MRLIVFAEDYPPVTSGGALVRSKFVQLASAKGHDIVVFTPRREGTPSREINDGVTILRPRSPKPESIPAFTGAGIIFRFLFSIYLFLFAAKWMYSKEFDAIHSASPLMHWPAKLLSVLYRVPLTSFVGYTPSVNSEDTSKAKLVLEKINMRFLGDRVFCRTPEIKNIISEKYNSDVEIIHGILDEDKIRTASESNHSQVRSRYGLSKNDVFLVFVGRFVFTKQPERVVEIVSHLPDKYKIVIIGDGPRKNKVENAIDRYELKNRAIITGELPHKEALKIISAADGFLLPSQIDTYPTVVFEALALGCETFSTPVGVLPSIDHHRLHVTPVNCIAHRIQEHEFCSYHFDPGTLDEFSMEKYTDTIISGTSEEISGK